MKVLICGAGGQLAWELEKSAPADWQVSCLSGRELDITDAEAVEKQVEFAAPDAVINAAAYTAVDKAEDDAEAAYAVNAAGVGNLARTCAARGIYLLHISTDFVFDGAQSRPYHPQDEPNPLSVYGASKLAGERELVANMKEGWAVIRTSWVYSAHGTNFVKSMLRLMGEKPALRIVGDQIGTPTWAAGLAAVCWAALKTRLQGLYHWSDAGVASWYDFAVAIQNLALAKGLLTDAIPIDPIATKDYPTPAKRPPFSVMDKSDLVAALPELKQEHWQRQLSQMLDQL